jgi:putative membrane protein (TIGR04086 family)
VRPAVAVVARGAGVALAVAMPAALVAQVIDAVTDDDPGLLAYPLSLVVLAGVALGGRYVAQRTADGPIAHGALAGLLAIGLVQALGVLRRSAGGDDVAWATVPVVTLIAVALAAAAAALTARQPGRTRP